MIVLCWNASMFSKGNKAELSVHQHPSLYLLIYLSSNFCSFSDFYFSTCVVFKKFIIYKDLSAHFIELGLDDHTSWSLYCISAAEQCEADLFQNNWLYKRNMEIAY